MTRSTEKPLNAGELIALLQQFPEDTPVVTEGCDCEGEAGGVMEHTDYLGRKNVMITRTNGKF